MKKKINYIETTMNGYIIKRVDKDPKRLAIKLKRSTNAVRKKIAQIKKEVTRF